MDDGPHSNLELGAAALSADPSARQSPGSTTPAFAALVALAAETRKPPLLQRLESLLGVSTPVTHLTSPTFTMGSPSMRRTVAPSQNQLPMSPFALSFSSPSQLHHQQWPRHRQRGASMSALRLPPVLQAPSELTNAFSADALIDGVPQEDSDENKAEMNYAIATASSPNGSLPSLAATAAARRASWVRTPTAGLVQSGAPVSPVHSTAAAAGFGMSPVSRATTPFAAAAAALAQAPRLSRSSTGVSRMRSASTISLMTPPPRKVQPLFASTSPTESEAAAITEASPPLATPSPSAATLRRAATQVRLRQVTATMRDDNSSRSNSSTDSRGNAAPATLATHTDAFRRLLARERSPSKQALDRRATLAGATPVRSTAELRPPPPGSPAAAAAVAPASPVAAAASASSPPLDPTLRWRTVRGFGTTRREIDVAATEAARRAAGLTGAAARYRPAEEALDPSKGRHRRNRSYSYGDVATQSTSTERQRSGGAGRAVDGELLSPIDAADSPRDA